MKQTVIIIGVDVSKLTLDICIKPQQLVLKVANDDNGFKQLLGQLGDHKTSEMLVVMEHTGRYSYLLESFLQSMQISYCKLNALEIKRSAGLIRGKNDKIDAQRIADYGWLRRDTLVADQPIAAEIILLKDILGMRALLVSNKAGYESRLKEQLHCTGNVKNMQLKRLTRLINALKKEIQELDQEIKELVISKASLNQNVQLLMSVKGVGWIVACNMLCCTNNFKKFRNARKFNCYVGVAPFKNESGTSIKSRSRVNHLANKIMKTYLNLAAFSACRYDQELKQYYQRRVQEGKSKMACINIIRAKLVGRMFAVIKRQTPFESLSPAA